MINSSTHNQNLVLSDNSITLSIKREDLIHPFISGNKYRKLKYNIQEAQSLKLKSLLTFGGAFSNHIAAVAYAGKTYGFKTIGVIRGDELREKKDLNPTLEFAKSCGMEFKFVTREAYRNKNNTDYITSLRNQFGNFYLIPEGGTNELAVKGCEEILAEQDEQFDYICCSVGTGGTISGIINSVKNTSEGIRFSCIKR